MSFVSEYVTPFFKWYNKAIEGEYLAEQLKYKGGKDIGHNYIAKVERYNRRKIEGRYDDAFNAVQQPTFAGFVKDNLLRLALNPFDRLIAAFAAFPSLKARFMQPGTFSHTFTEIMNEGVIFGAFKGIVLNFAQLGLVLYPSVYFANKTGEETKFLTFFGTYTALDTLFYPLDTLKNILYADTLGTYNLKTAANEIPIMSLWNGLSMKLLFNLPVLAGIYCTTQEGYEKESVAAWATAALLYPAHSTKVRKQVAASSLSTVNAKTAPVVHSTYRGVVPFILLNSLIGYSLRPLFSQAKLKAIEDDAAAEAKSLGLR